MLFPFDNDAGVIIEAYLMGMNTKNPHSWNAYGEIHFFLLWRYLKFIKNETL